MSRAAASARDAGGQRSITKLSVRGCGGANHLLHRGDLGSWDTAHLGMLPNDVLVFREIETEGLVDSDAALDLLSSGSQVLECGIRLSRAILEWFPL